MLVDHQFRLLFMKLHIVAYGPADHIIKVLLQKLAVVKWTDLLRYSDVISKESNSGGGHTVLEIVVEQDNGPKTVPWETPLRVLAMKEWAPSRTTSWSRFLRKDLIQLIRAGWNSYKIAPTKEGIPLHLEALPLYLNYLKNIVYWCVEKFEVSFIH